MIAHLLAAVLANDANWVSFGGAGAFAMHKTVHMLGEDINITLYDDKIHVRVYFSFENRGSATMVKMAFTFSTVNWKKDLVRYFASKVDGKAVSLERLKNVPIVEGEKEVLDEGWARNEIYVKEVEFGENQRRTVLVDYTTGRGMAGGGWLIDEYVISTGASWAGKIGTISVSVDWTHTKRTSRPDLAFYKRDGTEHEAQWQFVTNKLATTTITNVEPDFDLSLGSVVGFWNVWVDGKRVPSEHGVVGMGSCIVGRPSDPLVRIDGLGKVLHQWADKMNFVETGAWVYKQFVETVEGQTLVLQRGIRKPVARGVVDENGKPSRSQLLSEFVYLKDFIDAIGGKFKWNAELERIEITLPK